MDAVVDELVRVVGDRADIPFALFGHSMGAVIAVELARRLVDLGRRPTALVASACAAPHLPLRREHVLHILPRDALIDALIRLNGLPAVALERRDFIDTFMPTIRADLQCRETWRSTPRDLGIPVHVLAGKDDELVSEADALAWQVFTSTQFSITRFDGGHFSFNRQCRPYWITWPRSSCGRCGLVTAARLRPHASRAPSITTEA